MADYIKRETVLNHLRECEGTPPKIGYTYPIFKAIERFVEGVPAADVVEVVRCIDCAVPHNKWTGCPNLNGLIPPPDFCCARGERRVDNA